MEFSVHIPVAFHLKKGSPYGYEVGLDPVMIGHVAHVQNCTPVTLMRTLTRTVQHSYLPSKKKI